MTNGNDHGRPLSPSDRRGIYAARGYLNKSIETKLGVRIPFDVYFQDPLVAEQIPELAFDENFDVEWEPGLNDGPTSARFAIVDYNGDTGVLVPPAIWDEKIDRYVDEGGAVLDRENHDELQFHQVNVWAILQRALNFFESGMGLGRRIQWGFEGNRLIVVPHAGYGENAFYDRRSKSLQFYYFDRDSRRIYTCLSTDIINHEFGHAVLDGIRPHYIEGFSIETAAFHEFMGDLTAILIILQNNEFRKYLSETTGGDLSQADLLAHIAEQFGEEVKGRPYLRSATSELKMSEVAGSQSPHHISEVLTGAMFEILLALSKHYIEERSATAPSAFWYTTQRMQRMAIQPLELLPPVDVTFKDYAKAVLRAEELSNPMDPHGYRQIMMKVFREREILDDNDLAELDEPRYLYDRLRLKVFHDIDVVAGSRADAYRFLDDNRGSLGIPANQDFFVADLYSTNKLGREARRLPRQIVLQYLWREEVPLEGEEFGEYSGQRTTMLCGGTLVFDESGNALSWSRKPGTQLGEAKEPGTINEIGLRRREALLASIARGIRTGRVGSRIESGKGLLGSKMAPFETRTVDGALRFELSPHLKIDDTDQEFVGGREWEISS